MDYSYLFNGGRGDEADEAWMEEQEEEGEEEGGEDKNQLSDSDDNLDNRAAGGGQAAAVATGSAIGDDVGSRGQQQLLTPTSAKPLPPVLDQDEEIEDEELLDTLYLKVYTGQFDSAAAKASNSSGDAGDADADGDDDASKSKPLAVTEDDEAAIDAKQKAEQEKQKKEEEEVAQLITSASETKVRVLSNVSRSAWCERAIWLTCVRVW
jgi:hypothetical protein